jgi:hypothetical protein
VASLNKKQKSAEALLAGKLEELKVRSVDAHLLLFMTYLHSRLLMKRQCWSSS